MRVHDGWLDKINGGEQPWFILRNDERYGDMAKDLPRRIIAFGTLKQAQEMADRLSNWYAGCDYMFYVPESDD